MASKDRTFHDAKLQIAIYAKYAVALRAVTMLREGDSLLIDAGTSLTPIAKIIKCMADNEIYAKFTHYTIMTHNRDSFDSLIITNSNARLNIFQTGGRYDRDLNASFGHQAENAYENFHPKWVFIGQSGIDADRGLFCHGNTEELSLKRIIFSKPAFCRVIMTDFTKLGIPGGLCFGTSDKLMDNVEHCLLLTNDPSDEFSTEKLYDQDNHDPQNFEQQRDFYLKKYERQVSILSETHKVTVIPALYLVTELGADTSTADKKTLNVRISLKQSPAPSYSPSWMGIHETGKNFVELKFIKDQETQETIVEVSKVGIDNRIVSATSLPEYKKPKQNDNGTVKTTITKVKKSKSAMRQSQAPHKKK